MSEMSKRRVRVTLEMLQTQTGDVLSSAVDSLALSPYEEVDGRLSMLLFGVCQKFEGPNGIDRGESTGVLALATYLALSDGLPDSSADLPPTEDMDLYVAIVRWLEKRGCDFGFDFEMTENAERALGRTTSAPAPEGE